MLKELICEARHLLIHMFPKAPTATVLRKRQEDDSKYVVGRLASGNVLLQRGRFASEGELKRRKELALAVKFSNHS